MTQEDKELLLIDLCARLPYGLKVQYKEKTYDLLGLDKGRIFVNLARIGEWLPTVYTFNIKPYLRSMSNMTEEEKEEFGRLVSLFAFTEVNDWLNRNHFEYRGLIEKGLAIEVTPDNNPYKE